MNLGDAVEKTSPQHADPSRPVSILALTGPILNVYTVYTKGTRKNSATSFSTDALLLHEQKLKPVKPGTVLTARKQVLIKALIVSSVR
jgi:hypothetical protein